IAWSFNPRGIDTPLHCGILLDTIRYTCRDLGFANPSITHENHNCISVQDDQFSAAQVNYVSNQPKPPYNDPHSNTYNPGWRNHPNFSWGGNQGQ
ncbi:hypothetical protein PIB30_095187, partial [Stylosanthes scabra]|nr:hypothetical protein [Stylosanthes scabra]